MVKPDAPIIQHEEFSYPGARFAMRISELASLEKGWGIDDDGQPEGEPISYEIFESMYVLLNALSSEFEIPNPAVGAVVEGGIQLMWYTRRISCEIDQNGITVFQNLPGQMNVQEYPRSAEGIHQASSSIKEHLRL